MKPEKQISEKKIEANRRNAQRSTGPRTDHGKQIASHNSTRHGFTGRVNILTPEDREAHDKFCNELIESFTPETPMERQFAHSIAEDSWRINGLRAAENNIFAEAAAWSNNEIEVAVNTANACLKDAKELQLLSLYEQRINRSIHKNLAELKSLQTERKARRDEALEEAKLLVQMDLLALTAGKPEAVAAAITGQALSPVKSDRSRDVVVSGGFVFSTTEVNFAIDRDNRLKQARDLNGQASSPQHPGRRTEIVVGKRQLRQAA